MTLLFKILLVAIVLTIGLMLICVIKGPSTFDRLNGIFVIGTDIIAALLILGLIDGRFDMYVDIALSYAILGFLSTVFFANYLKGAKAEKTTKVGNTCEAGNVACCNQSQVVADKTDSTQIAMEGGDAK